MRKSARRLAVAGVGALALAAAVVVGVSLWSGTPAARDGLLAEYFRARSEGDLAGAAALVAEGFDDGLAGVRLRPGDFSVWSFGEDDGGAAEVDGAPTRFVLVAGSGKAAEAWLAEASYLRDGIALRLLGIRALAEGDPVIR